MWRPRLPRRDPDVWWVLALFAGAPTLFCISQGAPVLPSLLVGVVGAGILYILRN